MQIVTAAQMREIDRRAILECGIPGIVLMENAGLRVVDAIRENGFGPRIVIVAGRGNNGGDGFVVARHLYRERPVSVWTAAPDEEYRGDALLNLQILKNLGITVRCLREPEAFAALEADLANAGLIVDALLGTGLSREVDPLYARVIERINHGAAPVLAVDIPSGVCADTGRILGAAVRADLTVTFALPKRGLLFYPGAAYTGRLEVADIGIPPALHPDYECSLLTPAEMRLLLPERPSDSHKGTFGSVLVVAGSAGMAGAAVLTARAALRGGCGLVFTATPRSVQPVVAAQVAETITMPLPENSDGRLQAEALPLLREKWQSCHALAAGPGWTQDESALPILAGILRECPLPVVLDADALNILANHPGMIEGRNHPLVVTPHPGEAARMLSCSVKRVQSDRIRAVREMSARYRATVVLKGAHTVIAGSGGRLAVNVTGNSGMATAGCGDVLTGLLASLLAQGLPAWEASCLAVYLHGLAGDLAAHKLGEAALLAGDLSGYISQAYLETAKIHM